MPPHHKFVSGWSPAWFIAQAHKTGTATAELVTHILQSKRHPEQGFRAALGILNLGKKHSKERLEKAARRALCFGSFSYHSLKNILAQGLEEKPLPQTAKRNPLAHENIRGEQYYNN